MKNTFTLLLIILLAITANAQQLEYLTEDDFVMTIIQAEIDGEDYSEFYVKNEAYLALYKRDGVRYFANVSNKAGTQSYGHAMVLDNYETQEGITASFLWKYANSYDDETGTAQIILHIIFRPVALAFELSMLTEDARLLVFKGYVNGSLK